MAHTTPIGNPFMLMLNPEVVFSAVEHSKRLGQLNRHQFHPLDRPLIPTIRAADTLKADPATDQAARSADE